MALWGHLARGVFTPQTRFEEEKKNHYENIIIFSLKCSFLISGLILMSYITDVLQKQQVLKTLFSYWWKLDGEICFLSGTWQV